MWRSKAPKVVPTGFASHWILLQSFTNGLSLSTCTIWTKGSINTENKFYLKHFQEMLLQSTSFYLLIIDSFNHKRKEKDN